MTFEKWLFDFQLTLHKEEILKFAPLFLAGSADRLVGTKNWTDLGWGSEKGRSRRVRENLAPTKALRFCLHKMRQEYPVVITLRRGKQVGEKMLLSFVWLNCMLLWAVWLEGLKLLLITLPFRKNLIWSFPAGLPSQQQGPFHNPCPPVFFLLANPLPFASLKAPLFCL